METLIFQPKNEEQLSVLKAFAKALKVPFRSEGNIPNKETIKAMDELKAGKGKVFSSAKELFASIK